MFSVRVERMLIITKLFTGGYEKYGKFIFKKYSQSI